MRPQRLGNGAPAQDAPPYLAADFGEESAALTCWRRPRESGDPAPSKRHQGLDRPLSRTMTALSAVALHKLLIGPVRIDERLQPQCGGASDQQQHRLARRSGELVLGGL